jgi:hypothetical protein
MSKYKLKTIKVACSLLPSILRTRSIIELLRVLLEPLNYIQSQFKEHTEKVAEHIKYTSQVFSLEEMIKHYLKIEVEITDGEIEAGLYFYNTEELKPVYFPTVYFTDSKTWTMGSFIVHCYLSDFQINGIMNQDKINKMKRLLDMYKFAGTTYTIVYDR